MKKKILIIGAGFLQTFLIKKANELGYYTIAIDKNINSIGFQYAHEFSIIDIVDQESCLKFAQSKNIDGVLTAATDYGVLSTAYIAKQLNLPGLDYEVAKVIKNKYKVRKMLSENKVDNIHQYYEVNGLNDLNLIKPVIKFPVIIKPCDGSGSKGVSKANSYVELKVACINAIANSTSKKALIEDFIDGYEYGVESFVDNGAIHVLGIMRKSMTPSPYYAELGHILPSELLIEDKIEETVKRAIKKLRINFGAVNMDVIVTKDHQISIVDVGARMGGNLIGSHIIPLGKNIDYMGTIIRSAVGDSVNIIINNQEDRNVVTRLLALSPGKVKQLPDFELIKQRCKVEIYHRLEVGSVIKKYQNNLDGFGYIVAVSKDISEAENRANEAVKLIDIGIIKD